MFLISKQPLKLNGNSEVFPILNLLTKKFLEDINNDKINDILVKCHFKDNQFSKINCHLT